MAILVGTAFYFGAKLGLALSTPPDYIATFWLPNTFVLAVLLLTVPRQWWIYFLAMTPAYFIAGFQAGYSAQRMVIFFSANCTEVLVAAVALRYFLKKDRINFGQFWEMAMFLLWAVLVAPFLSAFIASIATLRELEVNYWLAWRVWFLGDALGHLTLTPVIVMWGYVGASRIRQILLPRITEVTLLSIVIFLTGYFALGVEIGTSGNIPLFVYTPLPLMLWAAIRFSPREVCTAVFVISILSIWNAIHGRGPFVERSPAENVLSLQMFLIAISIPTMLLGSILAERKQADIKLNQKTQLMQLLQEIAITANEASSIESAMKFCLKSICSFTGWPIGHVYEIDSKREKLIPTKIWHFENEALFKNFREVTEVTSFDRGVGLPGQILKNGKPLGIKDVRKKSWFLRAKTAKDIGVKSGFGFPVLEGKKVVAVLEFFSAKTTEPDRFLLEALANLAVQLGRVTERKQAEVELQESEKRFRMFSYASLEGIVITENGIMLEVNKRLAEMLCYDQKELLGKKATEFVSQELQGDVRKKILSNYDKAYQTTLKKKDGSTFPVEVCGKPIMFHGRKARITSIRDLSERKRSEKELMKAKNRADSLNVELINQNKELEQVLFVATHDLRTPLVNIRGYSKLINDKYENIKSTINKKDDLATIKKKLTLLLNKDISEMFGHIHTSASKMDAFISGLLEVSRIGGAKMNMTPTDMNKLLPQLIKQFDYQIQQNGVEIEVLELPPCIADRTQIDQVFSNLIGNALKYMSKERKGMISISGKAEDSRVIYCVKDNGIGISKPAQHKIFNIFHQAHEDYKGEGIGLAIVQKIVNGHKGKVWVESEPEKGSKFYVSLPIVAEMAEKNVS